VISVTQYLANPETILPEITFWLFGSLARATLQDLSPELTGVPGARLV
jgi:iron complex transport system permease protein